MFCFPPEVLASFPVSRPRSPFFKMRALDPSRFCCRSPAHKDGDPAGIFGSPQVLPFPLSPSSRPWPDSNRLRCPGTTPLKSNQAWVMRRVIGPLPPQQGQALEDVIDGDRSTMAARCQRSGADAHGPPAVKTQSSSSAV